MNWDVNWLSTPERMLAELWTGAADRSEIAAAADEMDQALQYDPENVGESRPDGRRILFRLPLGILYRIHPKARKVEVTHLWRIKKKGD
jgi:hypothetical protein